MTVRSTRKTTLAVVLPLSKIRCAFMWALHIQFLLQFWMKYSPLFKIEADYLLRCDASRNLAPENVLLCTRHFNTPLWTKLTNQWKHQYRIFILLPYDHIQVSLQQDARALACYGSKTKVTQSSSKEWFQMVIVAKTTENYEISI